MIDWLEEILKTAEKKAQSDLLSPPAPSAGAALRAAMAGSGITQWFDPAEKRGGAFDPVQTAWESGGDGTFRSAADFELGQVFLPQTQVLSTLAVGRFGQMEDGKLARSRAEIGSGLRALYRRAGEAVRNTAAPAALSGITVLQESPGMAAGLTAEELDRAVRRDSRRYDGGMSIY